MSDLGPSRRPPSSDPLHESPRVPFLDLRVDAAEQQRVLAAIATVMNHGRFVMGPEVEQLEATLAARCRRSFAVGVGSGTDALWLGLRGLGIGPGDEVITTPLSWVATANAIVLTGAIPVFADIGPDLNLAPESVEPLITARTKAILFVDFTGRMADGPALEEIASRHGLLLVEDGSQAFGASIDGRPCGSFGHLSGMSLNPMKVFAAMGEAGCILTDDEAVRERLTMLRYAGTVKRQTCIEPSLNGRLDTLQAAILLTRLEGLGSIIEARQERAEMYDAGLDPSVTRPTRCPRRSNVHYTYTIQHPARDELRDHLATQGIETRVQHTLLIPQQPAFSDYRAECPNAEALVRRILSLPMSDRVTLEQVGFVIKVINDFSRRGLI